MKTVDLLYVDLFCGAGGTSTGVETATIDGEKCAKVIACVNHDKNAIASHAANHPEAMHFTEDIRTLELSPLIKHVNQMRTDNPNALIVLWASLECTNFSKAKGGQPRDADSRTLAEHLFRYIEAIVPDYVQIENVEEFMCWGDMDDSGKPISKYKGRSYTRWVNRIKTYGYAFDYRILNAADYGALTTRKRFFGIFAKADLPISWPQQTHASRKKIAVEVQRKNNQMNFFEAGTSFLPHRPVKEALDLSDEGNSIFREKPLSEKTLERIYAGLIKFVAGGKDKWLLKYNSTNGTTGKHNPPSIDEPCPTVACQNRLGIVQCHFIAKYYSGNPNSMLSSVADPSPTVLTKDTLSKVQVNFISKQYSGDPDSKNISIEQPAGTITCRDHHAFISAYYGNGHNHHVSEACPTVTCKDRFSLIQPSFIDMQYGNGTPSSINTPACTVTTNPKHHLVQCVPWIMNTNFNNIGSSIDEPAQTITANRKWHYLMNPQFKSAGGSVNDPCFTLIARMDKMPPYLISTKDGNCGVAVYQNDSTMTRKIKEFMAIYGIIDVKMRMLRIHELKRIMGFPEDYVLIGTQAEQKKYIGNAVEVTMARVICESIAAKLKASKRIAA